MERTWIVVSHRAGCRLLESTGLESKLTLIEEIDHPEGRYQERHIESDAQGRTYQSFGTSQSRYQPEESGPEHIAKVFANTIVRRLEAGRHEHRFASLVLVAEPRFLGLLRKELSPPLEKMVRGSVDKDLYFEPPEELRTRLADVLRYG